MQFILAQILGLFALLTSVIAIQFKRKGKILFFTCLVNTLTVVQFILLDALTGAIIGALNTIRCIVFFIYEAKTKNQSIIVLLIFEIFTITAGILTFNNIWDLLPILSTLLYTYGLWQNNITFLKISSAIMCIGWIIYDIIILAYVEAFRSFCEFISSIIAVFIQIKSQKNIEENLQNYEKK